MSLGLWFLRVSEHRLRQYQINEKLGEENLLKSDLDEPNDHLPEESRTDVDKAWEGIIYLLTGKPLSEAFSNPLTVHICGKHSLDVPLEYAMVSPRFLTAADVKESLGILNLLTDDVLRSRFNAEEMNALDIYPGYWEEIEADYVLNQFHHLKEFYAKAAEQDQAVIMYLS